MSHYGRVCLLSTKSRPVEERWLPCGGILASALYYIGSNFPVIPRWNCLPWTALRPGGRDKNSAMTSLFSWCRKRMKQQGLKIMVWLTIWVNPSQVRVPSIEEAVGKLTACASSGPDWPYALVQLHEGTHHAPLPKEGHVGILPQWGAEATPCRQVSQLEVHQLLITGPQIVYPIALNGHDEPVITSLPEPLASSISLTAGKPVYLEMDIPPPQVEEPDQQVLPLGKVSTIIIASSHKSTPPKSIGEGSMTREVRDLLSWAMLEMSGHSSESSTLRRPHPATVLMPPSHQPKKLLQLVDTSSQVSIEMAETSLEGIPISISPIAVTSRSESISPPVDAMELHANANKASRSCWPSKHP